MSPTSAGCYCRRISVALAAAQGVPSNSTACPCSARWWAIDALRQHCLCMQFAGIFQGMEGVGTALNAVEMCDCTQLAHHHRQKFFVFKVVFALLDARRKALYGGFGAGEGNRTLV